MKKSIATLFLLIVSLLSVPTVKADVYTDGIRTLMADGNLFGINSKDFSMMSMIPGNKKLTASELTDVLIDIITPYIRENMTEKELSQMVEFYSQEDVKTANAKVAQAALDNNDAFNGDVIMEVLQGGSPRDIETKQCDAEFMAAFERYFKVKNPEEIYPHLAEPMTKSVKQMLPDIPKEFEEQIATGIKQVLNYMKRNTKAMMLNQLVGKVTPAELNLLASEADQPFYAASDKAAKAVISNMDVITAKILEKMKE